MPIEPTVYSDPILLFREWYAHARQNHSRRRILSKLFPSFALHAPEVMTLATCTKDGRPSARIVLFKGLNPNGFVFFTNYESRKGHELRDTPYATLVFHWGFPDRQVRVEGRVTQVNSEESDRYWCTRPRGSRISALASPQSRPIASHDDLVAKVRELEQKYEQSEIPRPENWGGYCVTPDRIEFWEDRKNRLHTRRVYTQGTSGWSQEFLAP